MFHFEKYQDMSLLVLRIIVAAIFLVAAYYKMSFWSTTAEAMTMAPWLFNVMKLLSILEPIGAIAVLIGFQTRWAAKGLEIIMIGAVLVTKFTMQMGFVTPTGAGWNFPLMIFGGCFILVAFGAGKYSLDAKRKA